jgi:hypothetical protein
MAESSKPRRWYNWYAPDDSPEEKKLVAKLDLLIVPYAFILYWVKYIDQTNISKYSSLIRFPLFASFRIGCTSIRLTETRQCLRLWDV